MRAWQLWTTFGILPYRGAMADQPAYIVEAFELCTIAAKTNEVRQAAAARDAERRALLAVIQKGG